MPITKSRRSSSFRRRQKHDIGTWSRGEKRPRKTPGWLAGGCEGRTLAEPDSHFPGPEFEVKHPEHTRARATDAQNDVYIRTPP